MTKRRVVFDRNGGKILIDDDTRDSLCYVCEGDEAVRFVWFQPRSLTPPDRGMYLRICDGCRELLASSLKPKPE